MTSLQGPSPESVEVVETGRTFKVLADAPHLVSLGTGRLSTAVTLHPLKDGNTRVGNGEAADLRLSGQGVEPLHCVLETSGACVILHPASGMTTVDGYPIATSQRLHQGNVICLGASTNLRFNNPAEAQLMKNRTTNGDGRPPLAPLRQSWDEITNACDESGGVFNKVSKFEYLAHSRGASISPKVFPLGSATLNSPASAVLGHGRVPNGVSPLRDVENRSPGPFNGVLGYIEPPIAHSISNFPQKAAVTYSSPEPIQNGFGNPLFSSYDRMRRDVSQRSPAMPSPAFNRNPPIFVPDKTGSPLSIGSPRMSPSIARYSPADREEELRERTKEMLQAKMDRQREEELNFLEKQRLEEILSVCAEYERQAQSMQQVKPPSTPTMQQNRIKTNGSLPRDARSGGLSPSAGSTSDEELIQISHEPGSPRSSRGRITQGPLSPEPGKSRSPYENLNRPNQLDVTVSKHIYVENTLIIEAPDLERPPSSPRTRIRTTLKDQSTKAEVHYIEPDPYADYDTADPIQRRQFSPNLQRRQYLTPSQQLTKFSEIMAETPETPEDKFILPLGEASDLSDVMIKFEKELGNPLYMNGSKRIESRISQEGENDLPESERDILSVRPKENGHEKRTPKMKKKQEDRAREKKRAELASLLRPKKYTPEQMALKAEKDQFIQNVARLKSTIHSLQQQEDEILREMEFERALLEAEHHMLCDKRKHEEDRLSHLQDRQRLMDAEIEQSQIHDSEAQTRCLDRIRDLEADLATLSKKLGDKKESSLEYDRLLEVLDSEKKAFEDLEFRHLEEEANWLASREDLQREIDDVNRRIEGRIIRLQEVERQVHELQKSSENETAVVEIQKLQLVQQLEEARIKLKDLESRLSTHSNSNSNSSDNEEENEVRLRPKSKQSQEDLDRISRITSDAPIDVGKTGSLNRKTLESLQEIERNRHLHLATQGVQVIEEERKRVELLKRRVQDEVRAQWEQNRLRLSNGEANGTSNGHSSLISEDSSLASSDHPSDSINDEDVEKVLSVAIESLDGITALPPIADVSSEMMDSMISERDDSSPRDSRPISDYSTSDLEQSFVKLRDSNPDRLLQQRPLTRYLPIRGDSLNLRQHIETAGHQVDLCRHVLIDSTSCRGILHKMAGKFHHWNKRWFVFDRIKKSLTYYSDKNERKRRGGTYFQAIEEVYVDHLNSVKSPHPHLTFVIKTKERTYYLMAPSAEAMRIWVDVIFTGAEGYQEFEPKT